MKNKDLHQWLDKKIDSQKTQEFCSMLSPEDQQEFKSFQMITEFAQKLPAPKASDEFLARTMARIQTRPRPRRTFWTWLRTPSLSPMTLAAAAAMVAVVFFGWARWQIDSSTDSSNLLPTAHKSSTPSPIAPVMVRMVYPAPRAQTVSVAGDFNNWKPETTPMHRKSDGMWVVEIPLSAGSRHQYMFVVDDQWVTDPYASATMDDGFGGKNAILEL